MKKKYIIAIGVVGLIAVAAIGGTLASSYVESKKSLKASISEKALSVSIVDEFDKEVETDKSLGEDAVPGGEVSLNRSVSNSQEDGYDIYACVNVYYSWSTVDDEDAYKNKVFDLTLDGANLIVVDEEPTLNEDWILYESTPGVITMYYTKPIESGDSVCFLDGIRFNTNMDNKYAGAELELTYEVKAVQASKKDATVSEKAIAAEWGVFATIKDQVIVSISETRPDAE